MIHLIHRHNRHLYCDVLTRLYAARYQHFVVERGWRLDHQDGGERDVYDDDLAMHLVGLDADGSIGVSCRVRPTLDGGVLPDLFPDLIGPQEPTLAEPGVFECTRYFAAPHLRGRAGFAARSRLHVALLELMVAIGAKRLLGFVDLPLLAHLRRYSGLSLRIVGDPQPYAEDGVAVAFAISVAADDLLRARSRLGRAGRDLFDAPTWLPQNVDPSALADAVDVLINADAAAAAQLGALAATLSRQIAQPSSSEANDAQLRGRAA